MVLTQVNVTTRGVEETNTENTFQVAGDQTTLVSVDIRKAETSREADGAPEEINYDFAVGSSGVAAGVNAEVSHRSLDVASDLANPTTPTTITDFFTSIVNTGELHVIPRVLRNGVQTYDLFYTASATGLIDPELTHQQIILPPGELPTVINTGGAVIDVVTVFREWRGENRVFDVFILEEGT